MFINGCKTLITRCRFCGRLRKYNLNLFNLMEGNKIEYKCECGETNIAIQKIGNSYKAKIGCFSCGYKHSIELSLKDILKEKNILHCIYGSKLCFLGSEKKANQIVLENQISMGKSENIAYGEKYFNNFKIFAKALKQLYYLNSEEKINCDCGRSDIQIQLFSDRLELKCKSCRSVKIIFAETEEDLSILMKKDKISLREHNISCIDSIVERNRDIKE